MALFNKYNPVKPYEELKKETFHTVKQLTDEEILKILVQSFKLSKELRAEIVELLKQHIKKAMVDKDALDYAKLIENITKDDDDFQKAEFLAYQVLGVYIAHIIIFGKPLDFEKLADID
ncbi:hypothetical protein ACO3VM_02685 [Methanocaldococcus sp. 10A]